MDKVEERKRVGAMEKEQPAGRKILGEMLLGVFVLTFKREEKKILALTTIPEE